MGSIDELFEELGENLGRALLAGIRSGVERSAEASPAHCARERNIVEEATGSSTCQVPGCSRNSRAKGLCQPHYQKAYRLRLRLPASDSQLRTLSQDGRANRFKARPLA